MVRRTSALASVEEGEEELGLAHTSGGKLKWKSLVVSLKAKHTPAILSSHVSRYLPQRNEAQIQRKICL